MDNWIYSSKDTVGSLEKVKERIENTHSAAAEESCIRATFLKALVQFGSLSALLRHHSRGFILLEMLSTAAR